MALRDIFKVSRKTFFNPSQWLDVDGFTSANRDMWSILKGVMTAPPEGRSLEFDEVMKEKGLTEKDIEDGAGTYRALALIFVLLGLISLFYAIYLLLKFTTLSGLLLSTVVAALFLSQAFKYDFWAMQMRTRNLGLTLNDWKRHYLG